MRLSGIFEGRPIAALVPCLTLLLWIGTAGAAVGQAPRSSPESGDGTIEEIEITGRKSLISLRTEIANSEIRMFDLFNQFNDVREFTISCETVMITGSRIPERECVPYYMKWARQENVSNFLFSDLTPKPATAPKAGASLDTRGVQQSEQELWFQAQPKHREFNTKFRELVSEHPELASAALDLQTKKQRLAELEERQKNQSLPGRFFSAFRGNKED
jgi:hypothetical protein